MFNLIKENNLIKVNYKFYHRVKTLPCGVKELSVILSVILKKVIQSVCT